MMHDMSTMPMENHAMTMTFEHHCAGMAADDLTGMMLSEGHPVPDGYHKMPDRRAPQEKGPMMPDVPMHRH